MSARDSGSPAPVVCTRLAEWRTLRGSAGWAGASVGFVPTMGALHAGHVALLTRARAENARVVLSIFVNPAQFNDPRDLAQYPRTLDADLALAGPYADAVLVPTADEFYPDRYRYRLTETELSRRWEGAHRPGHFDGVLTVVLKLLQLVQPHRAYFGEKDWQQLQLVRGMVQALLLPVEVVACPTVRDRDGLALSSRNQRLSPTARARAAVFPRLLREASSAAEAADALRQGGFEVDYVDDEDGVRLGAIRLEGVRLIDNMRLAETAAAAAGADAP
jgi:pantoate--beta-alanine ligase